MASKTSVVSFAAVFGLVTLVVIVCLFVLNQRRLIQYRPYLQKSLLKASLRPSGKIRRNYYFGGKTQGRREKRDSVSHRSLRAIDKSNMAAGNKGESLADLFELQDKERLLEFNLYVSGGTKYKGRESSALSVLNKLRLEGEAGFCDVILDVEGRHLTTHRCVLAANSQFFYTMFGSGMKESNQKLLSLPSVCFTSLSLILDYFYTREIVINDENVLDLLNASSFLLVTPVKNACIQVLSRRLSSDNCFSVLQVAEQFGANELAKRANDYIKTNFSIVVNNEEFVSISQKDLARFISNDDIQVEKEEEVYQSVLKWVKHDEANRVQALPELLKHLRKDSLPKGFLESELTREPLLMVASSDGDHAPKKAKKTKGAKRSKKGKSGKSAVGQQLRPSTELHNVMIGIGTGDCQKAFCYDLNNKEMLTLPELSLLQYAPQVAVVGRTLYLVGGQKYNNESVKRVTAVCFDDAKTLRASTVIRMGLEWKTKTPCEEARLNASLVTLNGLLYYIGGWHQPSGQCSNTVECYDPEVNEWSRYAGVNTSRCKSGCVATKKHIFIIGGETSLITRGDTVLSSVEKYDPERNSWTYVFPLKEARSNPGCVYCGGKIYAIGGIDSSGFQTSSCEVYSPSTDEWESIAQLPYPHCGVNNVIIVKNQVTVPLNHDTTNFSCDALKYSTRSNKWQKIKNFGPSDKIVSFTLCTMELPVLILRRMPKERCPEDFFTDWRNSSEEDGYSDSESESSSFFGWDSLNDSDDYDIFESEGDYF